MNLPNRKLQRLKGYDYSNQNYYFVTICTHNKKCLFGGISYLNQYGKIAEKELMNITKHFNSIKIDKYVIMPNHVHAIVVIGCAGTNYLKDNLPSLSTVIGLYKAGVTKQIHEISPKMLIWQKSFYDKIIRTNKSYEEIVKYIEENPLKWQEDELYTV